MANLFFEPSTRTRVSFELAARAVGLDVVNIELARSSATKGESLTDTCATLAAMGVRTLVLRHPESGVVGRLADDLPLSVQLVNAGDGNGEHPSQALLDAATLEASGLDWPNATLAIIGDLRHSRVARSGLQCFQTLGIGRLRLAGPESLLPEWGTGPGIDRMHTLEDAVRGADAVMMLRVQHERMDRTLWPEPEVYARDWCLREEHLALAHPDCRVLHPGPINRGMEIDSRVADGRQALILEQVRMGVFARMAIFEWLDNGQSR
jgi:aspartate carbamoyltransferase catalytic subunit